MMEGTSKKNQQPKGHRAKEATRVKAFKILRDDHKLMIGEIVGRENLEDPDLEEIEKGAAKRKVVQMMFEKQNDN